MIGTDLIDYDSEYRIIGSAMFDIHLEVNEFEFKQESGEWDFSKACVICVAIRKGDDVIALMVLVGCDDKVDEYQKPDFFEFLHNRLLESLKAYGDDFPLVFKQFIQIDSDKLNIDWVYRVRMEFMDELRDLTQDEAGCPIGVVQGNA